MPSKSSSSKSKNSTKNQKPDQRGRQMRWARIGFSVFAVLLILSMVLALVQQQNLTK